MEQAWRAERVAEVRKGVTPRRETVEVGERTGGASIIVASDAALFWRELDLTDQVHVHMDKSTHATANVLHL